MNFLIFGDMHERINVPQNRIDNFSETVKDKVSEILNLAKKYKVKALLQPGDFLDNAKISNEQLKDIINRWSTGNLKDLLNNIENNKINTENIIEKLNDVKRIIGVIGNHETFGNSLKSFDKTGLATIIETGLLELVDKENPIFFTTEDGLKIAITGSHYNNKIDKENKEAYIVNKKLGDVHIHIVHGYLTNKNMGDIFDHTVIDDVISTKADVTIAGHDHIGFEPIEVNGKWFINPGAVLRLSNDKKEIKRKPKVYILKIDKTGITFKKEYLTVAKKGEEVLDREKLEVKKKIEEKLEEIKSLANKSKIDGGTSIIDIIKKISDDENINEDIKNEVVKEITKKMSELTKEKNSNEKYYIEKIELENFQSHKHTVLETSKGLNVFSGESCQGKSAILRALNWIYDNNSKNAKRLIKTGESYAKATITLSNGYSVSRIVEKKSNGKNGYIVCPPNSIDGEYNNTKFLPVVQEMLGFNKLKLDKTKEIPINFMNQGEGWYFIGDSYTNSDRSKIIGSIYETQHLDSIVKDLEGDIKKNTINTKTKKEDLNKINHNISKFQYLEDMDKKIKQSEKLYDELEFLYNKKEKIIKLLEDKKIKEKHFLLLNKLKKDLNKLEEVKTSLFATKILVKEKNNLLNLNKKKNLIKTQGQECIKLISNLKGIEDKKNDIVDINLLIKEKNKLIEKQVKFNLLKVKEKSINKNIYVCNKLVQELKNLKSYSLLLNELKTKTLCLNKANKLIVDKNNIIKNILFLDKIKTNINIDKKYKIDLIQLKEKLEKSEKVLKLKKEALIILKQGKKEVDIVNKQKETRKKYIEKYKNELLLIGECPICKGTINNAIVQSIVNKL